MFDPVEEALDEVARLIEMLAEADRAFAVGFRRYVRPRAACCRRLAQCIGVVSLVGKEHRARGQVGDHLRRAFDVALLSCRQFEFQRSALAVDERVDFRCEAAPGATQTAISIPLFAVAPC